MHERRKHPADYHAGLAIGHRTGTKRRWGHEKKVLVARQELLFEADGKGNLNSRLAMAFPSSAECVCEPLGTWRVTTICQFLATSRSPTGCPVPVA